MSTTHTTKPMKRKMYARPKPILVTHVYKTFTKTQVSLATDMSFPLMVVVHKHLRIPAKKLRVKTPSETPASSPRLEC